MEKAYTTVEEQVDYGLDAIDVDRIVEIPLRDLLFIHQTLGEFIAFFHQPMHFPTLEDVQRFLGNKDNGALHLLWECYYGRLNGVWPDDIREVFNEDRFNSPVSPYYHAPPEEVIS